MVEIIFTEKFEKEFKKTDNTIKEKAKKQISKIISNPLTGKQLQYNLKNERIIYVKPFRIIYAFEKNTISFLRFEHRKKVYN